MIFNGNFLSYAPGTYNSTFLPDFKKKTARNLQFSRNPVSDFWQSYLNKLWYNILFFQKKTCKTPLISQSNNKYSQNIDI